MRISAANLNAYQSRELLGRTGFAVLRGFYVSGRASGFQSPARGYYEWRPFTPKFKQRFYFTRRDGKLIVFHGLYSADGEQMAIITIPPSYDIAPIQNRMPIFLEEENWERYLAPVPLTDAERKNLIVIPPAGALDFYRSTIERGELISL